MFLLLTWSLIYDQVSQVQIMNYTVNSLKSELDGCTVRTSWTEVLPQWARFNSRPEHFLHVLPSVSCFLCFYDCLYKVI